MSQFFFVLGMAFLLLALLIQLNPDLVWHDDDEK
jgi:hypothetical protein